MTNCYNCGHTGTFVLLVQFALAVPDADPEDSADSGGSATAENSGATDVISVGSDTEVRLDSGESSLAVQCPACDSTDVNVAAEELLARYLSSTTS